MVHYHARTPVGKGPGDGLPVPGGCGLIQGKDHLENLIDPVKGGEGCRRFFRGEGAPPATGRELLEGAGDAIDCPLHVDMVAHPLSEDLFDGNLGRGTRYHTGRSLANPGREAPQFPKHLPRPVQVLPGHVHPVAVVPVDEEEADLLGGAPVRGKVREVDDVPAALRHLFPADKEVLAVHPVAGVLPPGEGLGHGEVVVMVPPEVVDAAGMDVEGGPEEGDGHRRVLDVPGRSPPADPRVPDGGLPPSGPVPEDEVAVVPLHAGIGVLPEPPPRPGPPGHVQAEEFPEPRELQGIEEDVGAEPVGDSLPEEPFDDLHRVFDRCGGPGVPGRGLHPEEPGLGEELPGHPVGEFREGHPLLLGLGDGLVLDVREGEDPLNPVPKVFQVPLEDVFVQEGAVVPEVGALVDGGPAAEELHDRGEPREEELPPPGHGVVDSEHASPDYPISTAQPHSFAAFSTAAATCHATFRFRGPGRTLARVGSLTIPARAWAAASFMSSVIREARASRAPRKMPGKASTLLIWFGKSLLPVPTTTAPAFLATSGITSGTGFAMAKTTAPGFMDRIIFPVTIRGAETPMKTSAPFMASARVPVRPSRFVSWAMMYLYLFFRRSGRSRWMIPFRSQMIMSPTGRQAFRS